MFLICSVTAGSLHSLNFARGDTAVRPKLPPTIGAEVVLLIQSPEVLRWLTWQGFEIFRGDGSAWRLRRRSRPGATAGGAEPYCPAGAARLIMAA
jgi:hypothetical protein